MNKKCKWPVKSNKFVTDYLFFKINSNYKREYSQQTATAICLVIFVFFFLVHVREKIIDRRLKVANQLNAKFLEHLGKVQDRELENPDQKEPEVNVGFVEISHEGDPGMIVLKSSIFDCLIKNYMPTSYAMVMLKTMFQLLQQVQR